jgi:hypothetical protein
VRIAKQRLLHMESGMPPIVASRKPQGSTAIYLSSCVRMQPRVSEISRSAPSNCRAEWLSTHGSFKRE